MIFLIVFVSFIGLSWLVHYLYVTLVAFKYWKRRRVPHFKNPRYPLGNISFRVLTSMPVTSFLEELYSTMDGPYMGLMLHTRRALLLKDPELINRILVTDFHYFNSRIEVDLSADPFFGSFFILHDERWKYFRQKLSPIFAPNRLRGVMNSIETKYENLEQYFEASSDLSFDFYSLMKRYVVDTMSASLLGIDVDFLNNPHDDIRLMTEEAIPVCTRTVFTFFFALLAPNLKHKLRYNFFTRNVEEFSVQLVDSLLKMKNSTNFIQKLSEIRKESLREDGDNNFPLELLAAQVFIVLLAGYEATGGTIAYCMWHLAKNPDIQIKAQAEVDAVIRKHGKITHESMSELTYIKNCINETLRLNPTLTFLIRLCNKDYHCEKYDLMIEKNTFAVIPLTGIHTDEKYYPKPHEFDPNRFLPEERAKRPSGTYMPFGNGQRFCFGKQMAKLIDIYTVGRLLQNYTIKLNDKSHQEKIEMEPMTPLLSPVGGCHLSLVKRC
ncbi:hypothetical protein DMENIID0001_022340 [Sergentomyia squamirostris]